MKVLILAGGYGTRLSEETTSKPKPMVAIGGMPILWHIMKMFAAHGYTEFAVALGYKGEVIVDFFLNYRYYRADHITVQTASGKATVHDGFGEDWTVHLVDTGLETQTGGRVRRLKDLIAGEPFMLTYGDGVSNVAISDLVEFHRRHGKIATVTAVRPPSRFGGIVLDGDSVEAFEEKPQIGEGWINGGFFVFQPEILDYIENDETVLEYGPLESLTAQGELVAYRHSDFWQCMDTMRDVRMLERQWDSDRAPWKVW